MSNETAIQRLLALREQYLRDGQSALLAETDARLRVLGHRQIAPASRPEPARQEEQTEVAAIEPQAERAVRKRAPKRSV